MKCSKPMLFELLSGHVSFHLFICALSIYWVPTMCQEHANHKRRLGEYDISYQPCFWNIVLFWSNVLNLYKGSWLPFNPKPNRSSHFWKEIWFGLNNIKKCQTLAWWELYCQNHVLSPGILVLMLGLKTSRISGIRCDFLVGAVCCQVKMLNNGVKIRRLNGASTLIFLPGIMEENQLAISGILMKTSVLLKTNGNWDRPWWTEHHVMFSQSEKSHEQRNSHCYISFCPSD